MHIFAPKLNLENGRCGGGGGRCSEALESTLLHPKFSSCCLPPPRVIKEGFSESVFTLDLQNSNSKES